MIGTHTVLELYDCANTEALRSRRAAIALLKRAAKKAKIKILRTLSIGFEGGGVSAIVMVAESHLSIHTWPEKGFASVDIFTCSKDQNHRIVVEEIVKVLRPSSYDLFGMKRGMRVEWRG